MIFLSEALEEERAEHMVLGGILLFLLPADQIPEKKQDVCHYSASGLKNTATSTIPTSLTSDRSLLSHRLGILLPQDS